MDSAVRPRPNHYQRIGLKPGASDEEIRRAFVSKMSLFGAHSMDEAAQILIAYETLRDAGRRHEYDRSIGLIEEATPPTDWVAAIGQRPWAPFIATAVPKSTSPAIPPPEARVAAEEAATPAPGSPIAAALRELAKPAADAGATPRPPAQPCRPPQPKPDAELNVVLEQIRAVGRMERRELRATAYRLPDWRRAAWAVGGLLLAAGVIGVAAGLSVRDGDAAAQAAAPDQPSGLAERSGVLALASTPPTTPAPAPKSADPIMLKAPPLPARSVVRSSQGEREPLMEVQTAAPPNADEIPITEARQDQVPAARLPLSDATVARTIERIGYRCGEVESATAVEGASGVYRVTCSSGQSYQASPVRGRYRFRRL